MATYKDIHGSKIQNLSSDPPAPFDGQFWYNSTSGDLKAKASSQVAAWSTGGALNTARALFAGGGTSTAALGFGGEPVGYTESYNGSNWTSVNSMNTARVTLAGAGASNTAALGFGGYNPPGSALNNTETWNGSNWTEVNNLNTSRNYLAGDGTNTSALAFGGQPPAQAGRTESWNGSNWTTVGSLNVPRRNLTGAGTKTAALAVGGEPPGGPPDSPTSTEEFNSPALVTQTLTTS